MAGMGRSQSLAVPNTSPTAYGGFHYTKGDESDSTSTAASVDADRIMNGLNSFDNSREYAIPGDADGWGRGELSDDGSDFDFPGASPAERGAEFTVTAPPSGSSARESARGAHERPSHGGPRDPQGGAGVESFEAFWEQHAPPDQQPPPPTPPRAVAGAAVDSQGLRHPQSPESPFEDPFVIPPASHPSGRQTIGLGGAPGLGPWTGDIDVVEAGLEEDIMGLDGRLQHLMEDRMRRMQRSPSPYDSASASASALAR
eukprot:CAMPEP_0182884920 /NCGR_PEP_ID=MMETSP0034_2-20130328/19290_1 /TAXON_ID=156128 /ORGANISM="Nephroselmis pyriformis, Strain CCMP717" /LENGTH=256 /DNA_ID=CAMNT_0025018155 /DNA_START=221 /DNA_END=988 /DNA_ORIENTATION=-